jgi:hypothetical protein
MEDSLPCEEKEIKNRQTKHKKTAPENPGLIK